VTEIIQNPTHPSDFDQTNTGQYTTQKLHPILDGIRQIMPSLGSALGSDCELVLHDFRDVRHSLVAIEGNVTNRSVGSPLTDLILQIIRNDETPSDLLRYPSFTREGRELISSTIFLRNETGEVIGCLCLNRHIDRWKNARDLLVDFLESHPLDKGDVSEDSETFVQDVEELLMGTINEVITLERKPLEFMNKADKIRIVQILDDRGIFLIRGAVQTVARALNVSRYTIYNYLEEVRQLETRDSSSPFVS
jgi:predicted transcriptional regulator YheO